MIDRNLESSSGKGMLGIGTLVWVGPSDIEICREPFSFCVSRFPQIAVRDNLQHLVDFPAQQVSDVIVVRRDRGVPSCLVESCKHYEGARLWAMTASECEGERRTGTPWPGFQHFYWHQWNQVMSGWFCRTARNSSERKSVRIITSIEYPIEPLAEWLSNLGHTVAIERSFGGSSTGAANHYNFDTVIWDDSAAPPADRLQWKQRLGSSINGGPVGARHVWLCGFPRIEDWLDAKAAGVHALVSKPYNLLAWDTIHA